MHIDFIQIQWKMLWKISSGSKGSFLVCMCWLENKCVFESNFDSLMALSVHLQQVDVSVVFVHGWAMI